MRNQKFYLCKKCGNLVGKIDDGNFDMMCCGEKMSELVPNTVEASSEKHLPVYTYKNNVLEVRVGSVLHPMEEKHHIPFVYVETRSGGQRKNLEVNKDPVVKFSFTCDEPLAIYAYCNLHGLWKVEVKDN